MPKQSKAKKKAQSKPKVTTPVADDGYDKELQEAIAEGEAQVDKALEEVEAPEDAPLVLTRDSSSPNGKASTAKGDTPNEEPEKPVGVRKMTKAQREIETRKRRSEIARQNVRKRWLAVHDTHEAFLEHFRQLDIDEALHDVSQIRQWTEEAARELQQRMSEQENEQRCHNCKNRKPANRQWRMIRPVRDPKTLLVKNEYFCSDYCVATNNKREQGMFGISDRGMQGKDNKRKAPEVQAQEEKYSCPECFTKQKTKHEDFCSFNPKNSGKAVQKPPKGFIQAHRQQRSGMTV